MPKDEHIAAAALHEAAAKSHRIVVEHYTKGDRESANQHAAEAFNHAVQAYAASKHASEKSNHHKTHA